MLVDVYSCFFLFQFVQKQNFLRVELVQADLLILLAPHKRLAFFFGFSYLIKQEHFTLLRQIVAGLGVFLKKIIKSFFRRFNRRFGTFVLR